MANSQRMFIKMDLQNIKAQITDFDFDTLKSQITVLINKFHLYNVKNIYKSKSDKRELLYGDLSTYIRNFGVTQALESLAFESRQMDTKDYLLFEEWLQRMKLGIQFEKLFEDVASSAEILQIHASRSNTKDPINALTDGIDAAKMLNKKSQELKEMMVKAIRYPAIMFAVVLGLLFAFKTTLLPFLIGTSPVEEWPQAAVDNVAFISLFTDTFYINLALLGGFMYFIYYTMVNSTGKIRTAVAGLPPYSLYRSIMGQSILMTLSTLMQSNIDFQTAIKLIASSSPPHIRFHLLSILDSLSTYEIDSTLESRGFMIEAMDVPVFNKLTKVKIASYSQTDDFASVLDFLAERMVTYTKTYIGHISSMIGTVFLVITLATTLFLLLTAVLIILGDTANL